MTDSRKREDWLLDTGIELKARLLRVMAELDEALTRLEKMDREGAS